MLKSLRDMLKICGSVSYLMKRSLVITVLVAVLQGIAYALIFPLFGALFTGDRAVWMYALAICGLTIVEGALRLYASHIEWRIYLEVTDEVRQDLGEHLKQIPLEALAARRSGDLNNVLTSNVQEVVSIASGLYGIVLNTIIAPAVTIVALCFVDLRLALACLVIFPAAAPLYRALRATTAQGNRASTTAHADTASQVVEYAQGLAVLRATRQVGARSARLNESIEQLRVVQTKANAAGFMPSALMFAVVQLGIVAVTALGVHFAFSSSLGVAAVCALIVVTIRFSEPLSLFANMAALFDFMEAGLQRVSALLEIKPLPVGETPQLVTGAHVEFKNVTFSYAGTEKPVLRELTCEFPEQKMTALVGTSGSGKTTVTKLISRYADPQSGMVRLGGVDVRELPTAQLMCNLSVVFQDVYLFDDSILENIRLAKPEATDKEVYAAAEAANCHDFITQLPTGYHTGVGEIGSALSGGERQRISIARAILKDAPIVILDEPTSALDTESEVAVQNAIDTLVHNKTVIVIAHRLSTIAAADNIIVLEEGEIAEQGNHKELLNASGRYAELWAAQQATREWRVTAS